MTKKLLAIVAKELLILWRDRAGLAVLFLMPVILVWVVSLVQHNVLKIIDRPEIQILLVNQDRSPIFDRFVSILEKTPSIELITRIDGRIPEMGMAIDEVSEGNYQFCLYIPEGTGQRIIETNRKAGMSMLSEENQALSLSSAEADMPHIVLYYNPVVQGAWRSVVEQAIQGTIFTIEVEEKIRILFRTIPEMFKVKLKMISPVLADGIKDISVELPEEYEHENMLKVDTKTALREKPSEFPNAVQQNIPAWTLFGMFFIVVPLSGSLIRERQEGTLTRLFTLPVSFLTILLGKISAYILICLIQCLLMLLVGIVILPFQGLPALQIGSSPIGLLIVAMSAAFAATGFGLMVGAMANNYEQGSMFGAVSVVIAAALGGVMLPTYVMPKMMQKLSAFSPLSWGMDAFLELFVKSGNIWSIFPQSLYLFAFGTTTTGVALWMMTRHAKY